MAASAICTINGSVPSGPVLLTPGTTCTVALVSTAGAADVSLAFTGASETVTYPTITRTGFGTFTFTVPANPGHGAGLSLNLTCRNTGDEFKMLVCVGTTNMIASNETTERGALGWAEQLNTNFRATVTGRVEFATHAAYRAAAELADGTFFTIVSPPGEWRYSATSGAGFTDDNRTILKRTGVLDAANGRAFSTRASATVPTFDALRGLRGSNQDHVHVQAHTTFGDGGGGIFDRAAIGSYVDDGGTVATASPNAWVRRDAAKGAAPITWWGADPTGNTACDAAFALAMAWQQANRQYRSLLVPDGDFLLTTAKTLPNYLFTLRGTSKRTARLRFAGGPSVSLFVSNVPTNGLTIENLAIVGGANCGDAAFDLTTGTGTWLDFNVDVTINGGWNYWIHATCPPDAVNRGAFQWGRIRLSNYEDTWVGFNYPDNGIYVAGGYFNCCDIHVDATHIVGDVIHIEQAALYPEGNYSCRITGNSDTCGRGIYLLEGFSTIIESWADENNTTPSELEDVIHADIRACNFGSQLTLTGVIDSRFSSTRAKIVEDADCFGNKFINCGNGNYEPVTPVTMSASGEGHMYAFATSDYRIRGGAWFGKNETQNILLNGDCERFIDGASTAQLWGFAGNYTATQCGDDCVDTTTTPYVRHSALIGSSAGNWYARATVMPVLDSTWLGCRVTATIKWRRYGETTNPVIMGLGAANIGVDTSWCHPATQYLTIDCGGGWYRTTMSVVIDAGIVSGGLALGWYGLDEDYFYAAEIMVSVGHNPPRLFSRCAKSPFYPEAELTPNGSLIEYTTGAPASAVDQVMGSASQVGDVLIEREPFMETTGGGQDFYTTGYRRETSSWAPIQVLTGLVGVP